MLKMSYDEVLPIVEYSTMGISLEKIIELGALPTSRQECVEQLIEQPGIYTSQEGDFWDFKREWPFSYSDEYFDGIARLIAAFSNSRGGIIIFGVHDEHRTAGHSKVTPNFDKFIQSLGTCLSHVPRLDFRRYDTGTSDGIDVLLVSPIDAHMMPIKARSRTGRYEDNIIWIRQKNEVLRAEPKHVPLLYCRSEHKLSDDWNDTDLPGSLPPSPATIKKFIGRMETIDKLFNWIKNSDEPRKFLFGKGGSGKTTIAYEVAKILKSEGKYVKFENSEELDNVIFISAKEKELNLSLSKIIDHSGTDFSNERGLYEAILTLGNWTISDLSALKDEEIKNEIEEFFNYTSNFIVIDDIDTLTTKGLEPGVDFLFKILLRAKRKSKILYTVRNVPSHSIGNSIEVPGLKTNGEYESFVLECAHQFKVQPPDQALIDNKLSSISERRPLVIESIIALRRSCDHYERAMQLFEQVPGDDVRKYVFQREWDSLPGDNSARYILTIMALLDRPAEFDDLTATSKFDDTKVKDAISEIREMFLIINEIGKSTNYSLGSLTLSFISQEAQKLDRYQSIRARVDQYKKSMYPENPQLSRLAHQIDGLLERAKLYNENDSAKDAWRLITDKSLAPRLSEDPRFLSLQAYCAARQNPPRLEDARRYFKDAMSLKYEPEISHLKAWFLSEKNSGYGSEYCLKIADFISLGKKYSPLEKLDFMSRKSTHLYTMAKEEEYYSGEKSVVKYKESLFLHLKCLRQNEEINIGRASKSAEYTRNTAFALFNFLLKTEDFDEFESTLSYLFSQKEHTIDPLYEPTRQTAISFSSQMLQRGEAYKRRSKFDLLQKKLRPELWIDKKLNNYLKSIFEYCSESVIKRIK